jgi:DNA-binding beta-propeller fold protein YncE
MFLTAPILTFDVITDPFPLLASAESGNLNKARLTVLATNGTGSDITLEGIVVQLPIGSNGNELTLDYAVIGPVPPPDWTLASTQTPPGLVIYAFHPVSGHATMPKGQSLAFVFNNIEVNRKAGSCQVEITEGSGNCTPPNCPVYRTSLTKFPPGWGQVAFWASPANIPYQGNTTLRWSGPQGATYGIEYIAGGRVISIPAHGDPPLANHGQYPGAQNPPLVLETTTPFTLNVSQRIDNEEFFAQQQVTVAVAPPPPPMPQIVKFHGSVALDGTKVRLTLSWITERADQVTITNVSGLQKSSDTLVIHPSTTSPLAGSYTLEARTGTNSVTSTVRILWTQFKSAPVGQSPGSCVILPDGSRLFSRNPAAGSISVFDPLTLEQVPGSPFKFAAPFAICPSPDSSRVYIVDYPAHQLFAIDSRDFHIQATVPKVAGSYLKVSPDGKRLYVNGSLDMEVYDTSTMKLLGSVAHPLHAGPIALTPDGTRAFIALMSPPAVLVIDTAKLELIATIPVGGILPGDLAVTPDGKQLFVADGNAAWIAVFDPVTLKPFPDSPIRLAPPRELQLSRDGNLLFVTGNVRLYAIETATHAVLGSTPFTGVLAGLAVSPDGVRTFVLTQFPDFMWMLLPSATGGIG